MAYKPKPGYTTCVGPQCKEVFHSPDVRSIRFCPPCEKRRGRDSRRSRGVRAYDNNRPVPPPE